MNGTYEQACSESALKVLRPAGILLVSPLNGSPALPGALRLAPTLADQGGAAAQLASALGATRIAVVNQRPGAAADFEIGLAAEAHANGVGPIEQLDASAISALDIVAHLQAEHAQVVALAGSPGEWSTRLLRELALLPKAVRPAVVAPQSFDTLAFLGSAGPAGEGVRVISRFVPAEQLGGSARSFAQAYADLHGEPPPVAAYAADAAGACSTRQARPGPRGLQ